MTRAFSLGAVAGLVLAFSLSIQSCVGEPPLELIEEPVGPFSVSADAIDALNRSAQRLEDRNQIQGVVVRFELPGSGPFELELRPRRIQALGYSALNGLEDGTVIEETRPIPVGLFVGIPTSAFASMADEIDAARISLVTLPSGSGRLEGVIVYQGVLHRVSFLLEPARADGLGSRRMPLISGRPAEPMTGTCDSGHTAETERRTARSNPALRSSDPDGDGIGRRSQAILNELPDGIFRIASVALVGDRSFLRTQSSTPMAHAELLANLHWSDAIFSPQIETRLEVSSTLVYTTEQSQLQRTDPDFLLNGFRRLTGRVFEDTNFHSHIHLITGQDLDGDTIGIAYVGGVCEARQRFGISQYERRAPEVMAVLVAHEIGHNFDMEHDSCPEGSPEWVMCPNLTESPEFSLASLRAASNWVRVIEAEAVSAACFVEDEWAFYE